MLAKTLLILGNAIFCYNDKGSIVKNKLQYKGKPNNFYQLQSLCFNIIEKCLI